MNNTGWVWRCNDQPPKQEHLPAAAEGYAAMPFSYSLPFGARAIRKCTLAHLCLFMIDTHDLDLGSFTCSDMGGAEGRGVLKEGERRHGRGERVRTGLERSLERLKKWRKRV